MKKSKIIDNFIDLLAEDPYLRERYKLNIALKIQDIMKNISKDNKNKQIQISNRAADNFLNFLIKLPKENFKERKINYIKGINENIIIDLQNIDVDVNKLLLG